MSYSNRPTTIRRQTCLIDSWLGGHLETCNQKALFANGNGFIIFFFAAAAVVVVVLHYMLLWEMIWNGMNAHTNFGRCFFGAIHSWKRIKRLWPIRFAPSHNAAILYASWFGFFLLACLIPNLAAIIIMFEIIKIWACRCNLCNRLLNLALH